MSSDITAANITFTSSGSADVFSDFEVFSGTQNDDAFIGDNKNNTFYGKGGNDYFYGGNGDNKYILSSGKNIVKGGINDDHVVITGRNYSSIILGGAGYQDILDFSSLERSSVETGVYVNGVDGYFLSNIPENSSPLAANLYNFMDEFEIYLGSNKDDIFIMGDSDDTVFAGIGSDYIKTGKGNNWILATINHDLVESDTIVGESDASDITVLDYSSTSFSTSQLIERQNFGVSVNMSRTGGSVEKYVTLNNNIVAFNSDIVDYISGINQVVTTDYNDIILGSVSNDYIISGLGDDIISGLSGNDTIIAGDGNDIISGDEGDDVFYGSLNLNSTSEDRGYDTYDGGFGTDALSYQSETFTNNQITARGGLGIYVDMSLGFVAKKIVTTNLHGAVSKDFSLNPNDGLVDIFTSVEAIVATSLDDVILGSDEIDIINAGNGADFVISGLGNDFVIAGLGSDTISLGGGDDRVLLTLDNIGQYTIYGGDGIDTIEYSDISESNRLNSYNFGIIANLSSGRVDRYNGSDLITDIENVIGSIKSDLILGNLNNNILSAGDGDDYIFGNNGDDSISGGMGSDILSGGSGDDNIYDEDGMGIVLDGAGSDTIYLGKKDTLILGSLGNDLIRQDQGSVVVSFSRNSGTDVIHANKLNTNASSIIISVSDNINLDDLKLGFHLTDTSLQKSLILSDGTSNLVLFDYLDVVTNNLSIILQLKSRDTSVKEFDFYDVKVLAQLATNSDPAVKSVMFKDTKNSAFISSSNNSIYGGQWVYQEMLGLELSEPGMHAFWDLANTTTQPLLSNKLTVSDTVL